MKKKIGRIGLLLLIALFCLQGLTSCTETKQQPYCLWYSSPASEWNEALPVGNGSMGAMIYGKTTEESIQFNEDTLWTGHPEDYQHQGASEVLPKLRQLLLEGEQDQAEQLASRRFMSDPLRQNAYQPFGQLQLAFSHDNITNYRRELDLNTALAGVSYRCGNVTFKREIFASYPDKVIVIHLTADKPGQLILQASLAGPHPESRQVCLDPATLSLIGSVTQTAGNDNQSRLRFQASLQVRHKGGQVNVSDKAIDIKDADSVTLLLTAATSYRNYHDITGDPAEKCRKVFQAAESISYEKLKKRHLNDYQSLFQRVEIDLGKKDVVQKETDARILEFQKSDDPQMAALLFQYGRYLLIASSRPGSQPANLQGVWNKDLKPAWSSKYTVNINTEMNYWLAEITNLSECHEPLFDMIDECSQTGAITARNFYDCPGWVLHHNTDLWRGTAPINASNHGIWPTGGAWLCQHLWLHYVYTQDTDFLRNRAYPIMKSAADFFTEYLIEISCGDKRWLISGPSNSPEKGGLVMAPTMDHQIIRNLFTNTIEASKKLNVDVEFREKLIAIRNRIAPNQIGQYGQLQEWLEDKDDPKNTHRHVSHLWGLHPGNEITRDGTPDLYAAARKSLEFRGDGGTGWSMAWKINFWARFHDGDHAYAMLKNLMTLTGSTITDNRSGGGLYPNMFDAHPPFQIDGNFGATSGIAEMLLQSHTGVIELLPALPSAWPTGSIKGIRARGGFEVSIQWKDGQLQLVELRSLAGQPCRVQYGEKILNLAIPNGSRKILKAEDFN
ncbi:MAG: glycoside hydrolase family 95 protein [Sedimentisphaerales bacterium]|nr:glycoside hydrolase family 95 protein [Sedimentisphaerales bacterium]